MISRRRFLCGGAALAGIGAMLANRESAPAAPAAPTARAATRELIRDRHFQAGFRLIAPTPGRRVVYGRLAGTTNRPEPVWDLDQWSSRFPLPAEAPVVLKRGVRRWANAAKAVTVGAAGSAQADLSLAVNSVVEYDHRARQADQPWVHLLVEQTFDPPPPLAAVRSARLRLKARLTRFEFHRTDDYSPGLHAAQFQMFLTLQNCNSRSPGCGKLVWFGIPLFDDRSRFPKEHKARDTAGSEMFIFTPAGDRFSKRSAHDGRWFAVDCELCPLFREALETAWQRGFLCESRDLADYRITTTNLGWEVPGLFEVEMQVRDLSLQVRVA